jgi:outer membrane protein
MKAARILLRTRRTAAFALACAHAVAVAAAQLPAAPGPTGSVPPPRLPAADTMTPPAAAAGPPAAVLPLTLAEAIERARAASPHLGELRSLAAAAGAGLAGARAQRLPQVDLSAGYTRQSDVPELRLALPGLGERTLFPNIPDNYRTHAGLALPLYTGGRIASTVAAGTEQLAAAHQDVEQGQADLALETAAAYWSLVTARAGERVLADSLADYEAHLKAARDRRDVGMAASNEVLAVEVQRDQAELAHLQAASGAAVANANLLRLLDLAPEVQIEPTEPLAEPAAPAVAPAGAHAASTGAAAGPSAASATAPAGASSGAPAPSGDEPLAALVAAAEAARPEIAALRSRIAANRASAGAARAGLRPQASLSAGYDYANPNPRILPLAPVWRSSWSAGAIVSLSLFDGGRTAAASAQLEAQADALAHRLEDVERRIRLEVTQRFLELAAARQAAAVAVRSIDSARENVRVARDRYHEEVIPSSELLDAETALLRSGLDRANALAQVRLALANLARALGK